MTTKFSLDFSLHVLSAYLSAFGLSLFFLDLLEISSGFSWIITAMICAGATFLLLLMTYRFTIVLAVLTVLCVPVLILAIFTEVLYSVYEYIAAFISWLGLFIVNPGPRNDTFELTLFIALVAVISLICFIFSCLADSTLIMFIITAVPVITLDIVTDKAMPYLLLLPCIFGIVLLFSLTAKITAHKESSSYDSHTGYWQTLLIFIPAILVSLFISFMVAYAAPAETLHSPEVTDATNDIFSVLHVPLPNTANRAAFNLGGLGYYPLHARLGGPVSLSDDEVMTVTSPSDLLLRAATYNEYDRDIWSSVNSMFSSLFYSKIMSDQTIAIFDKNRPDSTKVPMELYSALFTQETITITNKNDCVGSTLFAADHLQDIHNQGNTVYYNQSAELFQTKIVDINQSYTLTISHFLASSPDYKENLLLLEAYIQNHPDAADSEEQLKDINEIYLAVEAPAAVREYALALTAGVSTPLQKAFAIREDLLTNYTYSLSVEVPPEGSDFVEYFLTTKTGYCTYFATAMTVMAKINGIPARYVEGFIVDVGDASTTEDPGTVTVTEKSGHAWCEVYINGIGWIPIDATAASDNAGGSLSEENSAQSPVPTGSASYIPEEEDRSDLAGADAVPAWNPDTNSFPAVMSRIFRYIILPMLLLLVLLSGVLFIYFKDRWNKNFVLRPLPELLGKMTPEAVAYYLWKRSRNHLSLVRLKIEPSETVSDFAHRLQNIPVYTPGVLKDSYFFEIRKLAALYDRWVYGHYTPSEEELSKAYAEVAKIIGKIKKAHKSKYYYLLHFLIPARQTRQKNIKGTMK